MMIELRLSDHVVQHTFSISLVSLKITANEIMSQSFGSSSTLCAQDIPSLYTNDAMLPELLNTDKEIKTINPK